MTLRMTLRMCQEYSDATCMRLRMTLRMCQKYSDATCVTLRMTPVSYTHLTLPTIYSV